MTMRVRGLTLVATAMVNLRVGGASHRLANWRHGSGRRPLGRGIRSVHLPGKPDVRLGGEARECAGRRVRPDPLPRPARGDALEGNVVVDKVVPGGGEPT